MIAVACATEEAVEEVAVEEEHDHSDESTLDEVKERGFLKCGISTGATGFSEQADDGSFGGFDVDFCYAVAAAVSATTVKSNSSNLHLLKDSHL